MDGPTMLAEGRYTLGERLGQGGMASVYRGYDKRLQVWRAIKVLSPEFATKKKLLARFDTEARAMARIDQPHIVRVYDVGLDGAHPYLVMELCEGGSVQDWLERHGPMPGRLAARVIAQICFGLAAAHAAGIIHRDVKPHNALVAADGKVKVTDFGIARMDDDEAGANTRTGTVMGTLAFMAPEQRFDAKHVDNRADVYAVGATLFALLTARSDAELFAAEQDPKMLAGVTPSLAAVIRKACAYRREDRFAQVNALSMEVAKVARTLPPDPPDTAPLLRASAAPPEPSGAESTMPDAATPIGSAREHKDLPGKIPGPPRVVNDHATELRDAAPSRARTQAIEPPSEAASSEIHCEVRPSSVVMVHHECAAKFVIGGGTAISGALRLPSLLEEQRAMNAADARPIPGNDPTRLTVVLEGVLSDRLTLADLRKRCAVLDQHAAGCAQCPARVHQVSYGCVVRIPWPISTKAEAWLADRVATGDKVGVAVLLDVLSVYGIDGAPIRKLRRRGLTESRDPLQRVLRKGWIKNQSVDTDQLLQLLLMSSGNANDPAMCLTRVLAFDALVDAEHPTGPTMASVQALNSLTAPQRGARTQVDVGPSSDDPTTLALQGVLVANYVAWVNAVRILTEE